MRGHREREDAAGRPRGGAARTVLLGAACAVVVGAALWTVLGEGPGAEDRSTASAAAGAAAAGAPAFTDVALEAGLDFVHENGAQGEYHLFEIMGSGGAFVDYDRDGWLDVYLVQSGTYGRAEREPVSRLYRNLGDGRFEDVTEASGAGVGGYGMGCAAADCDGDGFPDLYVTRVGPDVLLLNRGDGTFRDATEESGLANDGYSSSAAWFDFDRDGLLDLYVAHYTALTPESQVPCTNFLGQREYCDPSATPQTRDLLYRNLGGGRFEDVSLASGVALRTGYGLAVACSDFDGDGWTDVYVANDQSPAFLWRNRGDGTFEDVALQAGCAYNGQGVAIAGMGIVAEDFDDDRDLDLFVTNIRDFSHLFLRNDGGSFVDHGFRWGSLQWMVPYTGFGTVAFDLDLDGRLELFVANGAVSRDRAAQRFEEVYAEPNQLLRLEEGGRYVAAEGWLSPEQAAPAVSRGVACGDYDNDGDVDLLVCRNGERPQLLRNELEHGGAHWLSVLPQDEHGVAFNAQVTVAAGERRWLRECRPQQSYLVSVDPRVHFGLGAAARVDHVQVRWPDGELEWFEDVPVDAFATLIRGEGSRERRP